MADVDPYPPFQEYAHPERLVSAPWLSARLGIKGLRVIEVDEDSLLYDTVSYTHLTLPTNREV